MGVRDAVRKKWYQGPGALVGGVDAIRLWLKVRASGASMSRGLETLRAHWPEVVSPSTVEPVFILAAGWRSGSTLLQRLVMSDGSTFVWGEPYSRMRLVESLCHPVRGLTRGYPDRVAQGRAPRDLARQWVATLHPHPQDLLEAQVAFLERLFWDPVREIPGVRRWGLKDVLLGLDEALFLHWLFPRARIVMLYRNPYDAYRSYCGRFWYSRWPKRPIFTSVGFGLQWRRLASEFVEGHRQVSGLLLSYEELLGDTGRLESYLGQRFDPEVLSLRLGGTARQREPSRLELALLRLAVEPVASQLGYF